MSDGVGSDTEEQDSAFLVFVPIWEAVDTCYMLFLDVKGATLYVLDVSRSPKSIVRREANMRRIQGVIYVATVLAQQEGGFSTRIFAPMIYSEAVRMRTATSIASCDANEYACFIDVKSELLWRDLLDRID
ncbi:uncharacterized protein DS421_9g276450 [Arachis hypogaea]|nr:uncharacterized protein DS421_9g276450 [Arachis hypogaea]